MFILFLFAGIAFFGLAFVFMMNDSISKAAISMVLSILFFVASSFVGFFSGCDEGRVQGLVDSGKYEIVSNVDYSLKELSSFTKIKGYYLKEVDENE